MLCVCPSLWNSPYSSQSTLYTKNDTTVYKWQQFIVVKIEFILLLISIKSDMINETQIKIVFAISFLLSF